MTKDPERAAGNTANPFSHRMQNYDGVAGDNKSHRHIGRRIRQGPLETQPFPPTHRTKDQDGNAGDTANPADTSDEGPGRSRLRHNKFHRHIGRMIREEPLVTQQLRCDFAVICADIFNLLLTVSLAFSLTLSLCSLFTDVVFKLFWHINTT